MNRFTILILFLTVLFFNSCANTTAQNYLKQKEIDKGIVFTEQELEKNPNDDSMNYYHGRFLLYKKKYDESIEYFKKAINENATTKHIYWLGRAYGKNKQYELERAQYLKILNERYDYKKSALIRLGRNYYKTKEYDNAVKTFEKVLYSYNDTPQTLYYYAKALKKINQLEKSKEYTLKFLEKYLNHSLAKSAVKNLNSLGDYSYYNYRILNKTISAKNVAKEKNSK